MTFHDHLDVRPLVARGDYEALDVRCNPVVLCRGELDRLDAAFNCTLTVEGKRLVDTVLLRPFLDPLVDRAKDFFVVRGSIREVHRSIFARYLARAQEAYCFPLPFPLPLPCPLLLPWSSPFPLPLP
jgi:hypothetical protein